MITSSVQTENLINDTYHTEAWEVPPDSIASAIYVDGVFKGMGFFAGEEGRVLDVSFDDLREDVKEGIDPEDLLGQEVGTVAQVEKNVELYGPVIDEVTNKPRKNDKGDYILQRITFAAKGILGRLLDASLYERGSALKPSMMQTLIYCFLVGAFAFMAGVSYGH